MIADQEKLIRITNCLRNHPQGLSIVDLSRALGINRNSLAKYLDILLVSGQVEMQAYGAAKVFYLSNRVPVSTMLEFSSDFVVVLDSELRIVMINEPFLKFLDKKREDMVGKNIWSVPTGFFDTPDLSGYLSTMGERAEIPFEFSLSRHARDYHFRVKLISSVFDDGSTGFTLFVEDITARKQSEHSLAVSEARYRGIVQDQTEYIVRFDEKGMISFTNDSFARYLNEQTGNLIGESFFTHIAPGDRKYVFSLIQSLKMSMPLCNSEYRVTDGKEEIRWQQWTFRAISDDTGRIVEYQGVGRDVTDRRKAEQRISQYIGEIKFLSSTELDFIGTERVSAIYPLIADHFLTLYPQAVLCIVYSWDSDRERFILKALHFANASDNIFSNALCTEVTPPSNLITEVLEEIILYPDPADLLPFLTHEELSFLSGSSGSDLTLNVCGLVSEGKLQGMACIFFRETGTKHAEPLVMAYLHQASMAIERCSAEEELRRNEIRYRTILELSPFPITILSPDGIYLYSNPKFTEVFGYSYEEIKSGSNWFEAAFPDPEYRAKALTLWKQDNARMRKGEVRSRTFMVRCKDGTVKEILFFAVTMPDETQFIAYQDLTERKKAQEVDRLLASIVKSTDDAVIALNSDGGILSWNPGAEQLFGYSANEIIDKDINILAPPGFSNEIDEKMEKINRGERVDHFETKRLKKDGTIIDVIISVSPLFDEIGYIIGASAIYRDNTELKKAHEVDRFLASIVKSTDDAIIALNANVGILSWNPSAEHLFGYSANEIIGKDIKILAPPGFAIEIDEKKEKIKRGERVDHYETKRLKKDGTIIDVMVTVSPLYDETGSIIGASAIYRDISGIKAEERLRKAEEQYRSLVDTLDVGFYRSTGDPSGHFVWGNSALIHILGYPSFEELSKMPITTMFVDSKGRKELLRDLRKKGFIRKREVELKRSDGKTIWVEVTALASFTDGGELSYINGIVEDISPLKETLAELATARKKISSYEGIASLGETAVHEAFRDVGISIAILHPNGSILVCNNAFEAMFGDGARTDIAGRSMVTYVAPEHRKQFLDAFPHGKKEEIKTISHTAMIHGSRVPVETRLLPILDESERIQYILAIITEIEKRTDKKNVFR